MSDITESTEGTDEATEAPDDAATDEALLGTAYPEDDADEAPAEVDPEPEPAPEADADTEPVTLLRGHRGAAVEALQAALCEAGHEVATDG